MERFLTQVRELIATMTPASRIMAGLLAGVIVVSLGWIVSSQTNGQAEYILGGQIFDEEQLNRMERALGEAGLRKYERVGNRLKVPTVERDQYIKAIAEGNAMPSEWNDEIGEALKSASNPLIAPSIVAEKVKRAREVSFERVLEAMPEVKKASVHHDTTNVRFARESQQSCSIFLRPETQQGISTDRLKHICEVATTTFSGLKPENVSVMDMSTGNVYRGSSDPLSADQQPYLRAQREQEAFYEEKVRPELAVYGDVKVGVHVELDPVVRRETEQIKYDPVGTASQSTNSRKDVKSSKASPGGRPGAEPNAAFANKSASVGAQADQMSETKESQENLQSVIGHTATLEKQAPFLPKRVSFTVGVPESYYRKVFAQRAAAKAAASNDKQAALPEFTDIEMQKLQKETETNIRAAIEGQLPQVRQGDDRYELVKVYSYPDLPEPEVPEPTLAETSLAWLAKSWSTLGLFLLMGMALIMMFSWVRSQGSSASEKKDREFSQGFGLEVPESMGDSLDLGETASSENGQANSSGEPEKPKFEITGGEIKEELSSLVRQNPDAAVNLLRSWIADAA